MRAALTNSNSRMIAMFAIRRRGMPGHHRLYKGYWLAVMSCIVLLLANVLVASASEDKGQRGVLGGPTGQPDTVDGSAPTSNSRVSDTTRPIEYIGEITKWFATTISMILGVFAIVITTVQIVLSAYLMRKEEQTRRTLMDDMSNKFTALRTEHAGVIGSQIHDKLEAHVRQFDDMVFKGIKQAIQSRSRQSELSAIAKVQLMATRVSQCVKEGQQDNIKQLLDISLASYRDDLAFLQIVSGKDVDVFTGLGTLRDTLSQMDRSSRPPIVADLLRAVNDDNGLRDRHNYLLARQICDDLYSQPLQL